MKLETNSPVDLHLHTSYSDGTWAPEQLIDHLLEEGFGAAAITDHDRVDTVAPLQQLAHDKGFVLLPAVEMSTHWHNVLVDVLCYGFDQQMDPLQSLTEDLLHRQQDNIWQTAQAMAQQGYLVNESEVQKIVEQPAVQQPRNLARLIRRYGYDNAAWSILDMGLQSVTTEIGAVVEAAHRSGGVCLIAHPGREGQYVSFDETLLDQLRADVPIDGFELYYPAHSLEQTMMYKVYAKKHNLLTSAGSDSHTPNMPPIKYRAGLSRKLLERLGAGVL